MENHNSKMEIQSNEMATAIHEHKIAAVAAMPQQRGTEATEQARPTSAKQHHKAASGASMDEVPIGETAAMPESLIKYTNTNFFDFDNDFSQSYASKHEHHSTIPGQYKPSFWPPESKNKATTTKPANSSSATSLSTTPRLPVPKNSRQDLKKQHEGLTENHLNQDRTKEGMKKSIQVNTSIYSGAPQDIRHSVEQGLEKWRKACRLYTEERGDYRNATKEQKHLASASAASTGPAFHLPKVTAQQENLTDRDRKEPENTRLRLDAAREKRFPRPMGPSSIFVPPDLPIYTKPQAPLIERNQPRLLDACSRTEPVSRPVDGGEKPFNLPQFSSKYTEYYYMNQQEERKHQISQRYPPRPKLAGENDKYTEYLGYRDEKSRQRLPKYNYFPEMMQTKEGVFPDSVSTAATAGIGSPSSGPVRPKLTEQELKEKRERNDQACKYWCDKVVDPSECYHVMSTSVSAPRFPHLYPHPLSRLPQLTEQELRENQERINHLKDRYAKEGYSVKPTSTLTPWLSPFQVPSVPTYFSQGIQQLQEQNRKRLIAAQKSQPIQDPGSASNVQVPKDTKPQKEKAQKQQIFTPSLTSTPAPNASENGPSNVQAPKTTKQESGQEKGNKSQISTQSFQDYHAQIEVFKQQNVRRLQMDAARENKPSASASAPTSTLNAGKSDPSNVPSVPKNTKQEPVQQKEKSKIPGQATYTNFADYCAKLEAERQKDRTSALQSSEIDSLSIFKTLMFTKLTQQENPQNPPTYNTATAKTTTTTTTPSKPSISSPKTQVQSQQNLHHLPPNHPSDCPQETCCFSPASYAKTNTKPTHCCKGYLDKKSNADCCVSLTCVYTPYPCHFAKELGCNMRWTTDIAAKGHGMIRHPLHYEGARIKDIKDTKAGKLDHENDDDEVVEEPISQRTSAKLRLRDREEKEKVAVKGEVVPESQLSYQDQMDLVSSDRLQSLEDRNRKVDLDTKPVQEAVIAHSKIPEAKDSLPREFSLPTEYSPPIGEMEYDPLHDVPGNSEEWRLASKKYTERMEKENAEKVKALEEQRKNWREAIERVRVAEGEYDRQKENTGQACKLSVEERVNAAQRVVDQHKEYIEQIVKERDELLTPAQREEKRQQKLWKECQDRIDQSRKDFEKFQTFKRRELEFTKIDCEMQEDQWIRKVGEWTNHHAAELQKIRHKYACEGKGEDELIKAHVERLVVAQEREKQVRQCVDSLRQMRESRKAREEQERPYDYTGNKNLHFILRKQNEVQAKTLEEAREKLKEKEKLDATQHKGKGREARFIIESEPRSAKPEHNRLWTASQAVKERQQEESMEESKDKQNDEGVKVAEEKEKEKKTAFLKEQQRYAKQADQFVQVYKQWETAKDTRPKRSRTKDLDIPADSKLDIVLSGYI